jgi:hypothetical protein
MSEFKVGDRVVHKNEFLNGEVTSIEEFYVWFETPDGHARAAKPERLMLAEPREPKPEGVYWVLCPGEEEWFLSQFTSEDAAEEYARNNCHNHGVLTVVKALAHVKPVEDSEVIYV